MEGPIQPVPIERAVPYARPQGDPRRQHGEHRQERPFALPGEAPPAEPEPVPEDPKPPHAHEDGVGERIDVTA